MHMFSLLCKLLPLVSIISYLHWLLIWVYGFLLKILSLERKNFAHTYIASLVKSTIYERVNELIVWENNYSLFFLSLFFFL